MASLPTGTLSILFTDIEGSTRLLQRLGASTYARLLGEHHRLLRSVIAASDGMEIKTEGDSFFAVFPRTIDAIRAAVTAQRDLAEVDWPPDARVSVRMGIHTGDLAISEGEYVGLDIHRAARISAAAHGGQVLLSGTTAAMVAGNLPHGVSLRDIGEHRLKDIETPEQLHQLLIEGLPADFPPPRTQSSRFNLLPADVSSFIGRDQELIRARELMMHTRVLTLTGPGGTGKTRLSISLARLLSDDFEDGVGFVALAPITDPGLVPATIRQALRFPEEPGQTALETLTDRLSGKHLLLVLDNFEQVAGAARTVAELIAALPDLTILVTSRLPLRISGEQEFAVPPLSVPTRAEAADLERLSQSDAVRLFVQRAQAVRPDFAVTAENAALIVDICARLDGLPLAIELAASRIKMLPPRALLDRLGNRLDLLQSTAADRTDRQRTLRGAIDWSYSLLSDGERCLHRRLAIFVGGARLEDAEQVVGAAGPIAVDVFDGLAALVDHSLVRQQDGEGDVRFIMLETIREFGLEQLDLAAERDATAEAHARRFAALAAEAEPRLTSGPEWLDRLEADHANIQAAIGWLALADIDSALVTAGRLWRFWQFRGHLRLGRKILSELLSRPEAAAPTLARAKALLGHAGILYWLTDFASARDRYAEAMEIGRTLGDDHIEAESLYSLAYVRAIEHDWDAAVTDFGAAEGLYRQQGNELMATWALVSIGMITSLRGHHEESLAALEAGRRKFVELGDTLGERNVLAVKMRALMHLGRLDEARELNSQVMRQAIAERDTTSLSASLLDAASLDALIGKFHRAARLTGAAQRIVDETGGQPPPALVNRIEAMPALQEALDAARLAELIAEGRLLTDDEAAALALTA